MNHVTAGHPLHWSCMLIPNTFQVVSNPGFMMTIKNIYIFAHFTAIGSEFFTYNLTEFIKPRYFCKKLEFEIKPGWAGFFNKTHQVFLTLVFSGLACFATVFRTLHRVERLQMSNPHSSNTCLLVRSGFFSVFG